MKKFIKIHPEDNVLVALKDLEKGTVLDVEQGAISLADKIDKGHKVALCEFKEGQDIIKYGNAIGHATKAIGTGEHIHTHNIKTNLSGTLTYAYNPKSSWDSDKMGGHQGYFYGYKRQNGDVGIRNELWIIPTVGCVNGTADRMVDILKSQVYGSKIDDICVLKHPYGCSQLGDDHEATKKILANMVHHPNAGAVLVLGLGCENNTIESFKETLGEIDEKRVKFLIAQDAKDEIQEGVHLLQELYSTMKDDKREKVPLSALKIGLKCGGSDGLSGITANPLVGVLSDYIIAEGGTTVLTEVPEMFGAETVLMERAEDESVFNKIVGLINGFKDYYQRYEQPIYENPSPGNKKGGISTLEDKSLGCTQKGGAASVVDVLKYGQRLKKPGLNLFEAPGNDLVATTALASTGCQMVLFTTGRGTPFGGMVPTMKISTNSEIYNKKPHWIDFNAGRLIEDCTMEEVLGDFVEYIIDVASGDEVNNEKNNFKELAIFKTGVTL